MNVKPFPILLLLALAGAALPGAAHADEADNYTLEEVQACSGDAFRFCQDALPDVHKIEACMIAKKSQLSKPCQAMFAPSHRH